ncbi:uncharacterized protein PAC_01654 [Phialocephala subalpina]|uniref:Uncharacterized protein n=1 Tax=Phialocephala subalpina TaxID=576137 RepID=A0A1L7WG86_9HELO|nr:uncharacterized protein PAC_01654 [Phialocephala subalpina]
MSSGGWEVIGFGIGGTITSHSSTSDPSGPTSKKSHILADLESDSPRSLEPLVEAMQVATARHKGGPIFHAMLRLEGEKDPDFIDEAFASGPPAKRPTMSCIACKNSLRQYGDLCFVVEEGNGIGKFRPLLCLVDHDLREKVPIYWRQCVENVRRLFSRIVLRSEHPVPRLLENSVPTSTSYEMLLRVLNENSLTVIASTYHMLTTDQLPRAYQFRGRIKFLEDVAANLAEQKLLVVPPIPKDPKEGKLVWADGRIRRHNLITLYAVRACTGFLSSLQSGMVGFLLEMLRDETPFKDPNNEWLERVDPLAYMRPKTAPTVGSIQYAECQFKKFEYSNQDLERVYLTPDQVPDSGFLWKSGKCHAQILATKEAKSRSPIFGGLLPSQGMGLDLLPCPSRVDRPIYSITFRIFTMNILPKWHTEPNTASWYTWAGKFVCGHAGLKQNEWVTVEVVVSFPHMWDDFASAAEGLVEKKVEEFKFKNKGIRYLFVLKDINDSRKMKDLCLFPEFMRRELHPVRKTIEAFSKEDQIEKPRDGQPYVGGLSFEAGKKRAWVVAVRTKNNQISKYKIILFE